MIFAMWVLRGAALALCTSVALLVVASPASSAPAGSAHITAQADGFQADGLPQPPLTQAWTHNNEPHGDASRAAPVSAGGRVFVLSDAGFGFVVRLRALLRPGGRSGTDCWGRRRNG